MKISIRKKIIGAFSVVIMVGGLIWFTSDYNLIILNRKLQIIENKNELLNTILEARRYEKNYFLFLDRENLEQAIVYTIQAEKKMAQIIENFGKYTLAKNLDEHLNELREYKNAMRSLIGFYQKDGPLKTNGQLVENLEKNYEEIRNRGRKVTEDMENMVYQERLNVNYMVNKSRRILFVASLAVFILCVLVAVFLLFNVNRPLKSIEDAIRKIAQGDFTNIPAISAGAEFDSLVNSLNAMIDELHKRTEQLVQSRKMASLGTLTSGVAHELNNPLNNISTSVQIVREELQEGNVEFLKGLLLETEQQVERARDIVKALLEFSRERSFSPKLTSLRDLVKKTIQLIKGEVPSNVELQTDFPDDICVDVDSRRIQQVLINLIINGIQAMEDGGTLKIEASEQPDKNMVSIRIQDTGKGIYHEDLPKIFDPFFTTKDVGKGSGLGLSVSHGIVTQHGGQIEVTSRLGEGTTFIIDLPGCRNPQAADAGNTG
jgi:signal transduction histidine kinase